MTKIVTLLYIEARLGTRDDGVLETARRVISGIELPAISSENDYTREILEGLLDTSTWLLSIIAEGKPVQREDFLQRITINSQGEKFLVDAVTKVVDRDNDDEKMHKFREQSIHDLSVHLKTKEVDAIITKAKRRMMFERNKIDWSSFVRDIIEDLEPLQRGSSTGGFEDLGVTERINVDDNDGIAQQFRPEDEDDDVGNFVFKFGWQGLNRMFGEVLGLRRVDVLAVSALSHNFKSGLTLNMFRQAAVYNDPAPTKDGRKPMLLHISYEMTAADNYKTTYAQIMLNETGQKIDPKEITLNIAEVSAVVKDRLQKRGWTVEFVRIDPDNSNFRKLFALIEHYEKLGFEIQLCVIDYLGKLNREGCTQGAQGVDIKNLYSRVRNFFNRKKIALITAHQMSSEALGLTKMHVTDQLVNEVAGKGYYDGCRTLHQELDMEIYCHIVENNGSHYLTIRRGKHRGTHITPHKDLYTVYKFAENLAPGFPDDVLSVDRSMRRVGEDQSETNFIESW